MDGSSTTAAGVSWEFSGISPSSSSWEFPLAMKSCSHQQFPGGSEESRIPEESQDPWEHAPFLPPSHQPIQLEFQPGIKRLLGKDLEASMECSHQSNLSGFSLSQEHQIPIPGSSKLILAFPKFPLEFLLCCNFLGKPHQESQLPAFRDP